MSGRWSTQDVPDQAGRVAVITGATGGIGLEAAKALGARGATVVLTGRDPVKLETAVSAVGATATVPPESVLLELTDLSSVAAAGDDIAGRHSEIDLLINNAGVMALPKRSETADGFEIHLSTNHFGHFALTAHLAPLIVPTAGARVVTVSSAIHHLGRIDFDDLHLTRRYRPWSAYAQSKLANLLFALELDRRLRAAEAAAISAAAHPGIVATDLQRHSRPAQLSARVVGQSAANGALPILYAATDAHVVGGGHYGPTGFFGQRGGAGPARMASRAEETDVALRLWEASEKATGVRFPLSAAP